MNLKNKDEIALLKSSMHTVFDTPQGKEVMAFIEQIGSWTPTVFDSLETNEVIARDANRRLIGTIKTFLELSPEQINVLVNQGE